MPGPAPPSHSGSPHAEPSFDASHIAVVVPAFNEARSIRSVIQGVLRQVRHVIVVDDGSTDGT
ncbi:MAG: glycosyltransferase family 2 protein, partial [Burkholderiales bacterium]